MSYNNALQDENIACQHNAVNADTTVSYPYTLVFSFGLPFVCLYLLLYSFLITDMPESTVQKAKHASYSSAHVYKTYLLL